MRERRSSDRDEAPRRALADCQTAMRQSPRAGAGIASRSVADPGMDTLPSRARSQLPETAICPLPTPPGPASLSALTGQSPEAISAGGGR